jgi:hypothetical protein
MEFFRQVEMVSRRGLLKNRRKETRRPAVSFRSPRNRLIAVQLETLGAEAIHQPQHGKTQPEL